MPAIIAVTGGVIYRTKESRKEIANKIRSTTPMISVRIIDVVVPGHPAHELGILDINRDHIITVHDSEDGSAQDTGG